MLIHSDGRKRGDEKSREGKKKGPDATEAFVKVTQTPSSAVGRRDLGLKLGDGKMSAVRNKV